METKHAYEDKMDARLREWQAKIDVLKARVDKATAEQKIKYNKDIESLRNRQQQLYKKLDELRSAGSDGWEDLKTGVDQAYHDLKSAVERAGEKFEQG